MMNVYEIKNYLSTVTFKKISIWNHFISLFRKKISSQQRQRASKSCSTEIKKKEANSDRNKENEQRKQQQQHSSVEVTESNSFRTSFSLPFLNFFLLFSSSLFCFTSFSAKSHSKSTSSRNSLSLFSISIIDRLFIRFLMNVNFSFFRRFKRCQLSLFWLSSRCMLF